MVSAFTPIKKALEYDRMNDLATLRDTHPFGIKAHPTAEHYLPLLYVAPLRCKGEALAFPYEGFEYGSISMRSVFIGG